MPGVGTLAGAGGGAVAGGVAGLASGALVGAARDLSTVLEAGRNRLGNLVMALGTAFNMSTQVPNPMPNGDNCHEPEVEVLHSHDQEKAPSETEAVKNKAAEPIDSLIKKGRAGKRLDKGC